MLRRGLFPLSSAQKCLSCSINGYAQVVWTRNLRENLEDTSDDGLGPHSQVVGVAYLQELEALCITATGGEILLVEGPREVQEVHTSCHFTATNFYYNGSRSVICNATIHKTWSIFRLASCKRASSAVLGVLTRSSWLSALGPDN